MESKELIEALKDNKVPFGLMSSEMQAMARDIGFAEFECYENSNKYEWGPLRIFQEYNFGQEYTYRLRPDYQPEPELVEIPVLPDDDTGTLYFDNSLLYEAISNPDFIGFKYEDGKILPYARKYVPGIKNVSGLYAKDYTSGEYKVLTPTHCLFRK